MSKYSLRDFGNYTVAGRLHRVCTGEPRTINFTRSASYTHNPRGHFAVEHAYVQYFIPEPRRPAPPIVLVHGGGMHGSTWENTPDGRPGWLQLLVSQGFEVHVVDNVERGRSGFAVGVWEGEPLARSLEEAWTLFRIGEAEDFKSRMPFQGSRFPVEHFANFSKMLVPRWLSTSRLHIEALLAVLERTGPAVVFCHSQGGEIAVDALQRAPEHFVALVAIEPSVQLTSFEVIRHIPTVLMAGDFLDRAEHWSTRLTGWQYWAETVSQQTANALLLDSSNSLQSGHTHLPMLDRGSELCLAACLDALEKLGVLSEFQPDLQQ